MSKSKVQCVWMNTLFRSKPELEFYFLFLESLLSFFGEKPKNKKMSFFKSSNIQFSIWNYFFKSMQFLKKLCEGQGCGSNLYTLRPESSENIPILFQRADLCFSNQNDLRNPKMGSKQSVVVPTEWSFFQITFFGTKNHWKIDIF